MTSLAVEGNPLLIREPRTIQGNASRIKTNDPWKSLTIEGSPLLISKLLKNMPYYRTKTLSIL